MSDHRTFKLDSPLMKGEDVEAWQKWLNSEMDRWDVDHQIKADGVYGAVTRDLTASVAHGNGLTASEAMRHGVTPELRIKLRNHKLLQGEKALRDVRATTWLPRFRDNYGVKAKVSVPTPVITGDSWGYHPPVHDGVDLIAPWNNPMLAMCAGKIVRADDGGWWGKGAKPTPGHPVSDGDGIIILECGVNVGPFKKGLHICYGHGEHAAVKVGQKVQAGQYIGKIGWANVGHIHLMVNNIKPVDGFYTGRGDRDPMPYVNYARKEGS
jgi:murein DD-endopeptidase MepM/ murein hydrolase activator NlpD